MAVLQVSEAMGMPVPWEVVLVAMEMVQVYP